MGAYLRGAIQVSCVASDIFLNELVKGYESETDRYGYLKPYWLGDDKFQSPFLGFLVKYGSMEKIKGWLIELSNRHNQIIMVTMDYDDQSYDAFTNIPGALPKSKRFWGYDGPFDRETDEREIRETSNGF